MLRVEKKRRETVLHINYVYEFWGIFSESKSTNTNLEGLTDKYNVKCYVQVFTESRARTTPSPVRGIELFGMAEDCSFVPQNSTFGEKQFIFCRIKESLMPSWNALLWKRPKSSSNCNGLERPSPPGQQFTFQLGYLWDKAVTTNHPLNSQVAKFGTTAEEHTHTDTVTNQSHALCPQKSPGLRCCTNHFVGYHKPAKLACNKIPLYGPLILPTTTMSNTNWHKEW